MGSEKNGVRRLPGANQRPLWRSECFKERKAGFFNALLESPINSGDEECP